VLIPTIPIEDVCGTSSGGDTTTEENILQRVRIINARFGDLKTSPEPAAMYFGHKATSLILPESIGAKTIDTMFDKITCITSNVPGPTEFVYLNSARINVSSSDCGHSALLLVVFDFLN
jgi:hypothetical protein